MTNASPDIAGSPAASGAAPPGARQADDGDGVASRRPGFFARLFGARAEGEGRRRRRRPSPAAPIGKGNPVGPRRRAEPLSGGVPQIDDSAIDWKITFVSADYWSWERILTWYMRFNAILWMAMGLYMWARITGFLPWRGHFFWDMPIEWRSAIVYYGVLDLVVSVGLWLAAPWGVVIWLFTIVSQIVTHSAFSEIFGERPFRIPFYAVTVFIYVLLAFRVRRTRR